MSIFLKRTSIVRLRPDSVEELRQRAHQLIPGGAHTYSKGDDQFPINAPAFIARGKGATVWDTEGNAYLDWGMGLRSVVLGHAYPRVLDAVREQLEFGSNFVRPSPIEVELAEVLVDLLPSADMVKYAKNGSDVTTAAVRLARAYTERDLVAICKDNPFYSFDDWFIGTTVVNAGIPKAISHLTVAFPYGDLQKLEALFAEHPGKIACVMIEPAAMAVAPPMVGCRRCVHRRMIRGSDGGGVDCHNVAFLAGAKELAHKNGALLIFDEMITGFRWDMPGAQTLYGIKPDLSCFGKAIGNGFSLSVLVGRREVMELGGIRQTERPKVFLLSATHGGETHAIAAALATICEMQENPVISHIWRIGEALEVGLNEASQAANLQDFVRCEHYPCSPAMTFLGSDDLPSVKLRTLFLQEMAARRILIPWIAPSFSHTMADVERTVEAAHAALAVCRRALEEGFDSYLLGSPVKPVFRRFN